MSKQIADTLKSILDNKILKQVTNRESRLGDPLAEVLSWWDYDLFSRKPGPAYRDGVFVGTDLDLACFLYALVDRGAVIILPEYKRLRAKQVTQGEILASDKNRHGRLLNLTSNQKTFVFSVLVDDMNVVSSGTNGDRVGSYRNFAITGFDGDWYEGWDTIQFMPSKEENEFLTKARLWSGDTVVFKNFVHPLRWTSFYGQYYFITKVLIDRLEEESAYLRTQINAMLARGVNWPKGNGSEVVWPERTKVAGVKVKVKAFEVEVDVPEYSGTYQPVSEDELSTETLVVVDSRLKGYSKALRKLRFMTRATELALFKRGDDIHPSWIEGAKWERDYVEPGKRTKWDRLVLFQPAVGERGVAIRKRTWEKTEEVSQSDKE